VGLLSPTLRLKKKKGLGVNVTAKLKEKPQSQFLKILISSLLFRSCGAAPINTA
jgi:hypothetical protein